MKNKIFNELQVYVKGKFPLIFIDTKEVDRATDTVVDFVVDFNNKRFTLDLPQIVKSSGFFTYCWDMINGMYEIDCNTKERASNQDKKTADIINALEELKSSSKLAGFYIFKNVDVVLNTKYGASGRIPYLKHYFSDVKEFLQDNLKWVIFVGSIDNVPDEIKQSFTVVDFELPTENEIAEYVCSVLTECNVKIDKQKIDLIVQACKGMTLHEIDEAIKIGLIEGGFDNIDIKCIYKEKANAVKKSSFLEYIDTTIDLGNVGGMEILKHEINKVGSIYANINKAIKFGLKLPKGFLLIGVAGTGKTLVSKAIAKEIRLPLYRADISSLFGGIVGETERNTREFFKLIKAVSPAVIQIDEIEKAFSGSGHSGASDGGVTDRLVGSFLTYMQERDYPCFFVATCNDIKSLPSPFVRKGRWDEIFFIDLPTLLERKDIVEIKIRETGRDISKFDTLKIAQLSEGLTGAEIENAIQEALRIAFYENREVTTSDICGVVTNTKGIAVLKSEEVEFIRDWAKNRAKFANTQNDIKMVDAKKKRMLN